MKRTKLNKANQVDNYYEIQSCRAIQQAIEGAIGKSSEEIRFLIRRTYPFGPLRRGRPYKIWNRLVLAKEAELGLEPRRHEQREFNSL